MTGEPRNARVLALGGCGGVGRHAVRALLDGDAVAHVVVADRDGDRARAFAAECGPRASALRLDVTSAAALELALQGADLVLGAVGPFYHFGVPVLRACLDAGRDYVDVCDDWQPTLEMLELDERARARGVTAVIGLGITPGVSNLLAALAVAELDEPEEVVTGWDLESAMPETVGEEPSAATLHGVAQLSGRIQVRRGGADRRERPVRRVRLDYPGLGPRAAHTIGHPEPVTLPRRYPALRECVNVMTARPSAIAGIRALGALVNLRLVGHRRAARWAERLGGAGGETPSLGEFLARAGRAGRLPLPPLFALARGRRRGEPASVGVMLLSGPAGGIGGLTGVPLAVGARMLLAGQVARPGVLSPEEAFDPRAFLDVLAPRCDPPRRSGAELVLVSRSWEPRPLGEAIAEALAR